MYTDQFITERTYRRGFPGNRISRQQYAYTTRPSKRSQDNSRPVGWLAPTQSHRAPIGARRALGIAGLGVVQGRAGKYFPYTSRVMV